MTVVSIDLSRLRDDIERKRKELADLEAMVRVAEVYAIRQAKAKSAAVPPKTGLADDFSGLLMFQAINQVMRKSGRSMRAREIADALSDAGYGNNVSNLSNSVTTAMRRKPALFAKKGVGLWTLKNLRHTEEEAEETPQ